MEYTDIESRTAEFTRDDTRIIKAAAIILMCMYHLWAFPNRLCGGELKYWFKIFGEPAFKFFGKPGSFCLSIFFFIGGYGIYMGCRDKEYDIIGKVKGLYISYWKVFLIFIPIAFAFFSKQPSYCKEANVFSRYSVFKSADCFSNFLGLKYNYNNAWWFFFAYIEACAIFPIARAIFRRFSFSINFMLVAVISLLFAVVLPSLEKVSWLSGLKGNNLWNFFIIIDRKHSAGVYIGCFLMGIAMAKDNMLVRLKMSMHSNNLLNPLVSSLIIFAVLYLKARHYKGASLDIFLVPFFCIAVCDLIGRVGWIRRTFIAFGMQSTNMWLIHCFFCWYFYPFARLVTLPRYALPCLAVLLSLSYIAAVLTTYLWKCLAFAKDKAVGRLRRL